MTHTICMAPDAMKSECSKSIVRAHTVSLGSSLSRIAESGHVNAIEIDKHPKSKGFLSPKLVKKGIKEASTFTAFCSLHDNKLFSPIEDRPFVADQDQIFCLHFRAVCKSLYEENAFLMDIPKIKELDRGLSRNEQVAAQLRLTQLQNKLSLDSGDLLAAKAALDDDLMASRYDNVDFLAFALNKIPDIMTGTAFCPPYCPDGSTLYNQFDPRAILEPLGMSLFSNDNKGFVVFTWDKRMKGSSRAFVKSLRVFDEPQLVSFFVQLAFVLSGNIFFRPSWWDGLSDEVKEKIMAWAVSSGVDEPLSPEDLFPFPLHLVDWRITETISK